MVKHIKKPNVGLYLELIAEKFANLTTENTRIIRKEKSDKTYTFIGDIVLLVKSKEIRFYFEIYIGESGKTYFLIRGLEYELSYCIQGKDSSSDNDEKAIAVIMLVKDLSLKWIEKEEEIRIIAQGKDIKEDFKIAFETE